MTTYTAQASGDATNAATFNPNGVPTAADTETISGYTVTYPDMTAAGGTGLANTILLGGSSASGLVFQNSDASSASDDTSTLGSSSYLETNGTALSTVQFAGTLQNAGGIAGTGNTLIDGRAIAFGGGTAAASLVNTGYIDAGGNTVTIDLSNDTDINGNSIAAASSPATLQNSGVLDALQGTLIINADVVGSSAASTTNNTVPTASISEGGKIEFGGSVAAGQNVIFDQTNYALQINTVSPANETLQLDAPASFAGSVGGFGATPGEVIDMRGLALTGVTYGDGTLAAQTTGNVTAASFALGTTGAVGVQLSADGAGGTNITASSVNTGSQTANISALRNDATITPDTGSSATLSEAVAINGTTTTYLNSNQINFADGTDYYGAGTAGGQVELLFKGLLGRTADAASLGFYATQLQNGGSTAQVAQAIVGSSEFQAVAPTNTADQVSDLYQNVLGRTASASELQFWVNSGSPIAQIAASIVASPEAVAVQDTATGSAGLAAGVFGANPAAVEVQDAYQTVLGRSADAAGLGYWTGQLESGLSEKDLLSNFISSAEFQSNTSTQSNSGFVQQIQTNSQGSSDASGLVYWTNQLDAGAVGRADVAAAYANSPVLASRESSSITSHGIVTA